ncbi:MAG TPA: glycosyltransferase [Solirubrobacteraceae bacterium]|nr:glycosyltransferase [Solirubrobacteraceae bacterium]
MAQLHEVEVDTLPPERFEEVLEAPQWQMLDEANRSARVLFDGRKIWNVNSTAVGGGVAEMLQSLLAYARGAGVDARWLVIEGEPEFFALTKRLHHHLHGSPGDGGPLGPAEHALYRRISDANAQAMHDRVSAGDIVLLHDPQTAGMTLGLADNGAHLVWRSHIGVDVPNGEVRAGWEFLMPYVGNAGAFIFTRRAYVPPELAEADVSIIPPSIDVFSQKNHPMTDQQVLSILMVAGILEGTPPDKPTYVHHDGREDLVQRTVAMDEEVRINAGDPLIVQVSRWDPLKDPVGVMQGFADHIAPRAPSARLLLAGPSPEGVTDDPEGALVLEQVRAARLALPADSRARVHLASLPMADRGENAAIVNAVQRHATVVVQKSIAEGFGLTVAEAMWKSRPVVAPRLGGIEDQIQDGLNGVLLEDPRDLEAFGDAVVALLEDPRRAQAIGRAAHERVRAQFLGSRHLIQYIALFGRLMREGVPAR